MNSSPSDFMGYCSLAKKIFGYREAVGAWIVEIWSKYSLYFGYEYSVGDALRWALYWPSSSFFFFFFFRNFIFVFCFNYNW